MRLIIFRQTSEGTYNEVDLSLRTVILTDTMKGITKKVLNQIKKFGNGRTCRVEVYGEFLFDTPRDIFEVQP